MTNLCFAALLAAQSTTITVDPAVRHQTMSGWEAVDFALNDSPQFPQFIGAVLDGVVELGLNRIRLEVKSGAESDRDYWTLYRTGQIDYATWRASRYATVNDDGDPNTINGSRFHFASLDWTVDHIVLPLKARLAARGEALAINLCYVAFTGQITTGQYHHGNPQEYAEFVLATNLHLRSKYGWVPDLWEVILEPDNVSQWSGGAVIGNAMTASAARLVANGITPRFVAPATTNMTNASTYFDAMAAVPGALQYHEEIAYHRYGGVSAAALQNIATRGVQHGKKTSMLEWWSGGNSYHTLHEDLKTGRNSAWQSGGLAGDGTGATDLIRVTGTPPSAVISDYAKFLRQYWKFVRAGAVRLGASTSNAAHDPLAFVNADGKHVVVIKAGSAGACSVHGLPAGTYGIKYTTSSQYDVNLADVTLAAGQAVAASIPASGVLTVYAKTASAPPGTIQFSAAAYSVAEGAGTATITATRAGGSSGQVSATYGTSNGTATAADYATASGTLIWADGDAAPKTFTVTILNDAVSEGNETVNLTLTGSALGTPSTAILTIQDDDAAPAPTGTLQFSASAYAAGESAGTATITVTRTGGSSGALSVTYGTSNGTATTADYTAASGTLTWAGGDASSKTFTVTILNDSASEGNETVHLTLTGSALGTPSTAILTIQDDDAAPPTLPPAGPSDSENGDAWINDRCAGASASGVGLPSLLALGLAVFLSLGNGSKRKRPPLPPRRKSGGWGTK